MPEAMQNGEKYEKADYAIDSMQNAIDEIENISSAFEDAITYLAEAKA